jgi:hypothetical protein
MRKPDEREKHMMKKLGGMISAALLIGGAAYANDEWKSGETGQSTQSESKSESSAGQNSDVGMEESGTGGSPSTMESDTSATAMPQGTELTGKVVKVQGKTLYLEHMGAVVPLSIDSKTKFEEGWKSAKDIKEGQQVRASFEVKNQTSNVAKSIGPSAETGQGGSGLDTTGDIGVESDWSIESPSLPERDVNEPLPEDQGSAPSDEPIY